LLATATATLQPFVDIQALLSRLTLDFDLDYSVGVQEDAVGVRVNRNRFVYPEQNVFFSFDIDGLGWDQGSWKGPFDSDTGLTVLPDDMYRFLLKAVIAANQWDGTIPGAYAAWVTLFEGFTGISMLIQDHGDMSMDIVLVGVVPNPIILALFTSGELDLKPAGITLNHHVATVYPAGPTGTPVFGFDVENDSISGWDVGAWTTPIGSE
jgi:hypothetical protein